MSKHELSPTQIEELIHIGANLADFTRSPESTLAIPAFLCQAFKFQAVTFALVRQSKDDAEPQLLIVAPSGEVPTDDLPALSRSIIKIDQQYAPASHEALPIAVPFPHSDPHRLVTLFSATVDPTHYLLLMIHHPENAPLPPPTSEMLTMTSKVLARQIRCLLDWHRSAKALGSPFEKLTDREWMVLQALNSHIGEKQLAGQLSLSPHTLHSHIKSIYRKVGVQGRLPLVLRFQAALRDVRLKEFIGVDISALKTVPAHIPGNAPRP